MSLWLCARRLVRGAALALEGEREVCVGGAGGEILRRVSAPVVLCLNRAAAPRSVPECALRAQKAPFVALATRVPRLPRGTDPKNRAHRPGRGAGPSRVA